MAVPDHQPVLCQIANCAFEVVDRILDRDRMFAAALRTHGTNSHQIFREESITSEMVTTLKERFPNNVDVTLFTAAEEKRNGADWYWRIQKAKNVLHARVQAKRVRRSELGQQDSDGSVEIDREQLQQLILAIAIDQRNIPGLQAWVATYCRYDATPPCGKEPSGCESHRCGGNCTESRRLPSVWIAHATDIRELAKHRGVSDVQRIVEESLRLDCILPCTDRQGHSGPAEKGFALAPNLPSFRQCVRAIQDNTALRDNFEGALQIRV